MTKLVYFIAVFFFLTSCKQAIRELPEEDAQDNYSKIQLAGDTTVHKLRIDGQYTYVNEVAGIYYYAEDMTITDEQFHLLMKLTNSKLTTTERATITTSLTSLWPDNTVFYRLPEQQSLSDANYRTFLNNIQVAFNMITAQTDIRFVAQTDQSEYVQFVYATGNSSPLGFSRNRVNNVRIASINTPAIIAHEIMHSLGMRHEQCRPDRDEYIHVYVDRAQAASRNNFNIYAGYIGHGDFDFQSVMMYSSFNFAIDPNIPVMTKLDGTTFERQRTRLTPGDYAGINALYPAIAE
ncbi:M12 family metallopeptidase [Sphingobacterium oryzagri]|uniref:M12 family metallopeptidase n=1 Tax=Sphingobacterium oryzagri TaxID=3025669 RepID=A0ABY7WEX0_9SPHI|nr:M12 family metallopeptidase [Sphingobacterium sp. KACC 22765]WDF67440.1 M12 family metallopeptidase [Sphingobacterium sp. KACC 22765]